MENNVPHIEQVDYRRGIAADLKDKIDSTQPVTNWGFSSVIWTKADSRGGLVRVYVNDKKRSTAALFNIDLDGSVTAQWMPGHSLTRDILRRALGMR